MIMAVGHRAGTQAKALRYILQARDWLTVCRACCKNEGKWPCLHDLECCPSKRLLAVFDLAIFEVDWDAVREMEKQIKE